METYAVFLRGININGKNAIKMADLKSGLEELGYGDVKTYLNSGNAVFMSDEDRETVRVNTEKMISGKFSVSVPVYVTTAAELKDITDNAPEWWGKGELYDNLIFILTDDSGEDIYSLTGEPSEGLEKVVVRDNVIYWSFDRKQYRKCSWWKRTAQNGIAEKLTIRTAGTIKKVCGG